jgi:hypothetical protein
MAIIPLLEIKCGTCGYWMPAPAAGAGAAQDLAGLTGATVQCRKCLQRTTCTTSNMRLRTEGGVVA